MRILFGIIFLLSVSFQAFCQDQPIDDLKEVKFTSTFIEANKQKMLGMHSEALELYFDCLEIDPQSSASMFEISRLLYSQKDIEGAIKMLENAININPTIDVYKLFLVQLYVETKKYDPALKLSESLIKTSPYELNNYLTIANIYCQQKNYNKAKKTFDRAKKVFGDDEQLIDELLKCELQFSKYDNVYKLLNSLIQQSPDQTRYYYILAESYTHNKKYKEALSVYDKLLLFDYDTTNVHLAKLDLFIVMNDEKSFVNELQYIFSDPNVDVNIKIETLVKLSTGKQKVLSDEQYYEYVKQLFDLYPDNLFVRVAYSEYLISLQQYQEVLPHLYFIISKDKTNSAVFEHLLYIENTAHNWDSVFSVSENSLSFFPTNPLFYYYNGFSAYQLGKYSKSIDVLLSGLHYVQQDELKVEFYIQIAEAYYKSNSKKLSYQFYEKALHLAPTNSMVLNNYSYYLSVDNETLDKALEMTILSNKLSPNNPVYLDTYAWVLYTMKRYAEALEIEKKAYDLGGNKISEVVEHLGDIQFQLSNIDLAISFWKEALLLEGASAGLKDKIENKSIITH